MPSHIKILMFMCAMMTFMSFLIEVEYKFSFPTVLSLWCTNLVL